MTLKWARVDWNIKKKFMHQLLTSINNIVTCALDEAGIRKKKQTSDMK